MAHTVNGVGTTFIDSVYDERDQRPRNATEWFILCGLPFFPVRRAVLQPTSHSSDWSGTHGSNRTDYRVIQRRWLHPVEVLFVYVWRWCVAAPVLLASFCAPGFLIWLLAMAVSSVANADTALLPDWVSGVLFYCALFAGLFGGIAAVVRVCDPLRRMECGVLSCFDDAEDVAARFDVTR